MALKVPFYKQSANYTCGPTCLQMVFKFNGIFKSEKKLAKEAHTRSRHGTYRRHMAEAARKNGFFCFIKSGSSLKDIEKFIRLKFPIIVYFIEPADNIEHYAVIIGLDKNKIIMNDPWNGKGFKMNKMEFLSRWKSENGRINKWMMVASKTGFN
ncbi:MAG: C39 family peptidase [Candidatus Pacebacteria bacterium]|nr:C39 family peptidase [Candidatus Paceibacterota bacterium]